MLIELDLFSAREALLAVEMRRRFLGAQHSEETDALEDLARALRDAIDTAGRPLPEKAAGYTPTGSGV